MTSLFFDSVPLIMFDLQSKKYLLLTNFFNTKNNFFYYLCKECKTL